MNPRSASCLLLLASAATLPAVPDGAAIYARHCASCHGGHGEGAEEAPDPLHGTRNIEALTRYIDRRMPEDDPSLVAGADAAAVAAYIHGAFYSPEGRAGHDEEAPRRELLRLTNRQFRESVADLFASREIRPHGPRTGLPGRYYSSKGMNKKAAHVLDRTDVALDFDFGGGPPVDGVDPEQFSIGWEGSLLPRETGWHEFRVSTPNGARLYLNGERQDGDRNRRDDSGARRQTALIDEWVSSGKETRVATARAFLLGGRAYPVRLDFFKYQEPRAAVRVEWKPPHGAWRVLAAPYLSPAGADRTLCLTTAFPPDDASEGYERGSGVSRAWHDAVAAAAIEAANLVAADPATLTGTATDDPEREAKFRAWLADVAERAFRRPLDGKTRDAILDAAFAPGLAPEDALKRGVIRILTSPHFLYPELAAASDDDHTAAARLALAMWDSLPDAALREAAAAGELRNPEQLRRHAERMAGDPRARAKLDVAIRTWLPLDPTADVQKDPQAFPGFDDDLLADLRESIDRFLDDALWAGPSADFRELLTSTRIFANPRLAAFYELPLGDADAGFHPVEAASAHTAGVLTHPYLMARLAHHDHTSPIHRGVFLTRQILGIPLRPPPEAIAFDSDRFDPAWTTREKVVEMTREPSCMTCHETINPLGFALEHFDAAGRLQTHENERAIHADAEFLTQEGLVLHLRGPRQIAEHAAGSDIARRSFVRRMHQTQVHHPPEVHGRDALEALDAAFTAAGHDIRRLFLESAILAATPVPPENPTLTSQ